LQQGSQERKRLSDSDVTGVADIGYLFNILAGIQPVSRELYFYPRVFIKLKMLGQFIHIDMIEIEANLDCLKSFPKSSEHAIEVNEQFAVPVS
jgi:hypothetical protein